MKCEYLLRKGAIYFVLSRVNYCCQLVELGKMLRFFVRRGRVKKVSHNISEICNYANFADAEAYLRFKEYKLSMNEINGICFFYSNIYFFF